MNKNNEKDKAVLERIEKAISSLDDKSFTLYFFVADSKDTPNSSMAYIYEMAHTLHKMGYSVCMLYQLVDEYTRHELKKLTKKGKVPDQRRLFTGVRRWLGDKYADLPHLNIATGQWQITPADFLFIPDAFASMMRETFVKKIPCRRMAILQNFNYVTEFIPFGDEWGTYGITEAIVATDKLSDLIKSVFPYVRTHVINPYVPEFFRKPLKAKKLIVNIACPKSSDIEHIIKTFYWKYRPLQFVTFRNLNDFPIETYAEMLKEGAITIWHDPYTQFGHAALEAIRCGNIVIGKLPEQIPEWMLDEKGNILDNGVWYNNIEDLPELLSKVVGGWMNDDLPVEILDEMDRTAKLYTQDKWNAAIEKNFKEFVEERRKEFDNIRKTVETKIKIDEDQKK